MRVTLQHGLLAALTLLLLLAAVRIQTQSQQIDNYASVLSTLHQEVDTNKHNDELLKAEVGRLQRLLDRRAGTTVDGGAPNATGVGVSSAVEDASDAEERLLSAHSKWDWVEIAKEFLTIWPSVEQAQLKSAVASCNDNGTMYCQRLQVFEGSLYITDYRAIFFDRHYAPSRILPLLETLRRHPKLPDIDIVVAGNDEPRVPAVPGDRHRWSTLVRRYPGGVDGKQPPAIFASTVNRGTFDLPWLDFAWFFPRRPHKLRTPPWSKLHGQLVKAGGSVGWGSKIELAMHTGNVGSPYRKVLAEVTKANPETMFVNELFIGDHGRITKTCVELGLHRVGGFQQHKCFMPFSDQCGYKYLLNSASIGYANKFKSLLLCGSVVIYVRDGMRHKEFYEYGLLSGVHYVSVDRAQDVPAMVRWLRENDAYAQAVAKAGRARMMALDVGGVTDFLAELLTQYASRQRFAVKPQPGAVRIECEDDLWRHYSLDRVWMSNYLMQDNSTCVHPPAPGARLGPPGWGGSYAGSKPRCLASHDMGPKAQPDACNFKKPFSTAESWEPFDRFPKPHPKDWQHWMTG